MIIGRTYQFDFAGTTIVGKYIMKDKLHDGTKCSIMRDSSGIKYPIRKEIKTKLVKV